MKEPGPPVTTTAEPADSDVTLRKQAEKVLRDMQYESLPPEDAKLLHELRVHQIELQMQNDELRSIQDELELSRERYFELYDLAPVGYLTISPGGMILETNLTAASMLGMDKNELLNREFHRFICPEDLESYFLHRKQLNGCMAPKNCDLRFVCRGHAAPVWMHLQAGISEAGEYRVTLIDINQRKIDEMKLLESEERFKSLVMAAPIGVVLQERNHRITAWNETAERIFGVSASQAIGLDATQHDWQTFYEDGTIFPGADHPSMRTFATGKPCFNVVMKVLRGSGDFSWININTGPLFRNGEQTPYAVVITFADITERKQAESILQARLRISDYAHKHSHDELLTKVLDEAEALTGSQAGFFHFVAADQVNLTLQAWSSNTLTGICGSEDKGRHYPLDRAGVWADCIREKRPLIHNDYQALPNRKGMPDGHIPVQRELVVPIFRNKLVVAVMGLGNKQSDYTTHDMTTIQHLASLAWDIVNRKRAEEELSRGQEIISLFMKHSPIYAYIKEVTPTESRMLRASDNLWQRIGMSGSEMVGKTMEELFSPELAAMITADDQKVVTAGVVRQFDEEFQGRYYSSIKFPIISGNQTLLAGFTIDVTDHKLAEEALMVKSQQLEELNHSLEKRIVEAVNDLRRKDELLIQQGRMAAMGEMINNIAHQWRQPLNNIGLIVQSLQLTFKAGTLTTEVMNRDIANTMQLLQQMSATIDDFRNFFSQEKVLQSFSINDAVKRSLNFMLPSLNNSNIVVRCDEQPDVQTEGYPGEYTQAILNILTNAKDVLLEREIANPCIDIRIFCENGRSVVTIADNGGGIQEAALPKIFDPYFTTRGNGIGTGIGLFMSKVIIEKNMQGFLTARNTGSGAEFRIEL